MKDYSGHAYDALTVNGMTRGCCFSSLSSGSSQYIQLPTGFSTALATVSDYTIAAWVKLNSVRSPYTNMMSTAVSIGHA